jgi:hypothetical protein
MGVLSQMRSSWIADRISLGAAWLVLLDLSFSAPAAPAAPQKQKLEKSYKDWPGGLKWPFLLQSGPLSECRPDLAKVICS